MGGGSAALYEAGTREALTRHRERARGWAVCGPLTGLVGAWLAVGPFRTGPSTLVGIGLLVLGAAGAALGFGALSGARRMEDALAAGPWTPLPAVRVPRALVVRDPASGEIWPLTVRTVPWRRRLARPDARGELWWCGDPATGGVLSRPGSGELLRAVPVRGGAREVAAERATAAWPPARAGAGGTGAPGTPAEGDAPHTGGAPAGTDGPAHTNGPAGTNGSAHTNGPAGADGPTHTNGPAGTNGPAHTNGPTHTNGPGTGTAGDVPFPAASGSVPVRRRGGWRWVVVVGALVLGFARLCEVSVADDPQVELTVEAWQPDGSCTVTWTDPFDGVLRSGPYRCAQHPERPFERHRETGHVVSYRPWQGELYNAQREGTRAFVETRALKVLGAVTLLVGLAGGAADLLLRRRRSTREATARAQARTAPGSAAGQRRDGVRQG
ncbi:hypothetical protein ACGF1Z_21010 [Streptomyces sp. NPDC048018]|uniref:hypothetical protein n=1 Tax=Streptomyces sp. NPDC048018 TaxID=3365499 RepID=UPI00370F8C8F